MRGEEGGAKDGILGGEENECAPSLVEWRKRGRFVRKRK